MRFAYRTLQQSSGYRYARHLPYRFRIVLDRPIGGNTADTGHIQDRHARPGFDVLPCITDIFLAFNVTAEIGEHEVGVVMQQIIDQVIEHTGITIAEQA